MYKELNNLNELSFCFKDKIKTGEWFTIVIDCEIINNTYWGIRVNGENSNYFTQSSGILEGENCQIGDKVMITLRATKDINQIELLSFAWTAGASRGVNFRRVEVFRGYSYGTDSKENYGLINNPHDIFNPDDFKIDVSTLINGTPYNTFGGVYYWKDGNRVHVHLGISGLTINSKKDVYTLPQGFRPDKQTTMVIGDGSQTGIAIITITEGGKISVSPNNQAYCLGDIEFTACK